MDSLRFVLNILFSRTPALDPVLCLPSLLTSLRPQMSAEGVMLEGPAH